ncbi:MAG TPA: hypothetical protein VMV44_02980 [Rectinemataceae bacterium]|nr:hypothetical protein [Rectinemataceae bacterium]
MSANSNRVALGVVVLAFVSRFATLAEDLPPLANALPVEAPSSVFSAGNGKGELSATGSWDLEFLSSVSFFRPAGGGLQLGQVQPLLMTQTPDLLLDFNLFDRWYVEARVSPDAGATRYAMGYKGAPGESLEEVRIGNSGIGLPELPFVNLGDGGAYSFGGLVRAGGPGLEARAMLRYDQAERVHRTFAGSREISETTALGSDFIRGRWFYLPAVESGLKVYVQSAVGSLKANDGSLWRRLGIDEYSLEEGGRVLALDVAATTRLALAWDGLAASSIDLAIGGTSSSLAFDAAAAPYAYDPSATQTRPIEILSHYALVSTAGDVFVRDLASGKKLSQFVVLADADGSAELREGGGTVVDPRPFQAEEPSLYTRVPNQTTTSFPDLGEFQLVSQSFAASDGIPLDADAIGASIEVLRDGVPDPAFEVDKTKNLLILLRPPEASERIDLSYLRESSERKSGALTAGLVGILTRDDLSAWTALSGHLGIPGQGYASSGQDSPAWAELTAGAAKAKGSLTGKLGVSARMGYAESSGRYRIDGMEDGGSATSSYWPSGGGIPAGFTIAQVASPSFASAWPNLSSALHADGSASECLEIGTYADPSFAGSASFKRIVDTPPLSSFGSFTFFAKSAAGLSGSLSGASLTIVLDDGLAGHSALSVSVPLDALSSGWTRLRFDFSSGRMTLTVGEGGTENVFYPSSPPTRDFQVTAASRVDISVAGMSVGQTLDLDEFLLEDPLGSASLDLSAKLAYKDKGWVFGARALPILSGIDARLTFTGELADQAWGFTDLGFGTALGPFDLDLGLSAKDYAGASSMSGRHSLSFAPSWSPLHISDQFAPASDSDSYSKDDKLSLSLGALGRIGAELGSIYSDDPLSSNPGLLQRSWKLSIGDGSIIAASAAAGESSSASGRSGLGASYFDRWYGSFADYMPYPLGTGSKRRLSSKVDLLPFLGSPLLSGTLSLDGSDLGAGDRGLSLGLRAGTSIGLPGDIHLSPWYSRTWTARRSGIDGDLISFAISGLDDLYPVHLPWSSLPFAEFATQAPLSDFSGIALDGSHYSSGYTPQVGLKFERAPGISPWELLIPQTLSCSYSRELTSDGFSVLDTGEISGSVVFSALELFGSQGAYPLFKRYANDEYRLDLSSTVDIPSGAGLGSWTLAEDVMVSLLGERAIGSDRLVATERYDMSGSPAGTKWNASGGFDLAHVLGDSWLLSVFALASSLATAPIAGLPSGLDSLWLRSILASSPIAKRTLSLDCSLASTTGDDPAAYPSLSFDESLESRISVPDRLEAWSKLKLGQALDSTGTLTFDVEASLGLSLSF